MLDLSSQMSLSSTIFNVLSKYNLKDEINSVRNESKVSIDVTPLSECIAKSRREQEKLQRGKEEQLQRDGLLDLSAVQLIFLNFDKSI